MDEVVTIRQLARAQEVPIRALSRQMGKSRNTIRRYVRGAEAGVRKTPERKSPVADGVRSRIEEILEQSKTWTAGKQRLTAHKVFELLIAEQREVSYSTVKTIVREMRRVAAEVFVPLEHQPGDLAQADFFEVLVDIGGIRRKAWLFLLRLMHSGRDFARIYERQDQVSFLDALVRAFEYFGGVPRRVAFDNLKAAVARILLGSERQLSARFAALRDHYCFEACFARPGEGHDKGGVEARGGAIRIQHLVPIPSGESLDAINAALLGGIERKFRKREEFERERAALIALPPHRFDAASVRSVCVARNAVVRIENVSYSVPSKMAGLTITARILSDTVELCHGGETVRHRRLRAGQRSIDYRHFLRELGRKPQALRQVAHRLVEQLGDPFTAAWERLLAQYPGLDAARRFAQIIKIADSIGIDATADRLRAALRDGDRAFLFIAHSGSAAKESATVVPAALANVEVEQASAHAFDRLLAGGPR